MIGFLSRSRLRIAMVGTVSIAALAAGCTPGYTPNITQPGSIAIALPSGGGTLDFSALGQQATITVSEAGYAGAFSAASSNAAVATISPSTVAAAASKRAQLAPGSATFTVASDGVGSATITIHDQNGASASFGVIVAAASPSPTPTAAPTASPTPVPGVLTVSPTGVSIVGLGAATAQSVTVSEGGYTGTFTESDTCGGIATIASSNPAGPSASFTVTGSAVGTCSATFGDTFAQHATLAITVTTVGVIVQQH